MDRILRSPGNLVTLFVGAIALIWMMATPRHQPAVPHFNVPEVDLAQARALVEAGAMVLDVRGQEQFTARHLPGAIVIPLAVLQSGIPASLVAAKDRPIVVYCNQGLLHGPEATQILHQAGFTHAVNLKAGIEGWAEAGLPIIKG